MNSLLSPLVKQTLRRSRFRLRSARATSGIGERHSRGLGLGIDFADYRMYQPGDDFRHLDHHVHARLGQNVIRQYALDQQAVVTVLLDTSASMGIGTPGKLSRASELAAALAFIALQGSDRLIMGAFSGSKLTWYPRSPSLQSLHGLLGWLEKLLPQGSTELPAAARHSRRRLRSGGLLIVISDWMAEQIPEALAVWAAGGQEIVAIQVLAVDEDYPSELPEGPVHLHDIETGEELLHGGGGLADRYQAEFSLWQQETRAAAASCGARWFDVRTDEDMVHSVLHGWRQKGLIT